MRKLIVCVLAVLLSGVPAFAEAPAGVTKGVKPAAAAALDGASRSLVVGADIFIGDQVSTGPKGQVQILFNDNTKLVVGPNSSLKMADYLVRNNGDAGKFVVDMLSGSFRFATGDAPKNKYEINTPTGTIGVRGTEFDVFVYTGPVPFTRIMHYLGVVLFRANGDSQWQELHDLCTIGQIADTAAVLGNSKTMNNQERNVLKQEFRYADNEAPLLRPFWVLPSFESLHRPTGVDAPPPQNEGPETPAQPPVPTVPIIGFAGPLVAGPFR
jgi:hypothetical protein